ncbi:MAG: T9SS type A sorting domain-containing protein, partial [Bacteroidota bacterium]
VAVYSASDCNDFSTFDIPGANDDELFSPLSRLNQYCLTPGETYYIMVDGVDGFLRDEGNFLIRLLDIFASPLSVDFLTKDPSCPGVADGSALAINPSGGSGNYFFSWSTGDMSESVIGGLGAGTITVNMTDDCDTLLVETFTLNEPPALGAAAGPDQLICVGDSVMIGGIPLETGGAPAETERFYTMDFAFDSPNFGLNVHKPRFPEIRTQIADQFDFGDYYMTFDSTGQIIYMLNRFSNELLQYNLNSNVLDQLGIVEPNDPSNEFWTGLSYDRNGNLLYAIAGEGPANQSYLYEITPALGGSTASLAVVTEVEAPVWIAVDTFGIMYAADFFSDSLFIIVQGTGERVGVGLMNINTSLFSGADFDPSTNRLYVSHTDDFVVWNLYEVDPFLGATELIFPYLDAEFSGALAIAPETVAPYLYLWGPAPGLSSTIVQNPIASPNFTTTYFATVTDGCNTTAIDTVVVTVGQEGVPALSSTPDNGTSNGSASVAMTGGTPPFTYAWSNGGDSSSIAGLDSGTYAVTVTDSAGCVVSDSIEVSSNVSLDDLTLAGLQTLEVFPNPTKGLLTVRAELAGNSQVNLRLTDLRGKVARSTWPQVGRFYQQTLDLGGLARGVYLLTIQTDQGQVQQRVVLH